MQTFREKVGYSVVAVSLFLCTINLAVLMIGECFTAIQDNLPYAINCQNKTNEMELACYTTSVD